jgi:hypothetical protein
MIVLFIELCVFVFVWLKIIIHGMRETVRIVKERFLPWSERPFPLPTKRQTIALLTILAIIGVTYFLNMAASR